MAEVMIVTRATVVALHTFTCWTNLVYPTRRDWLAVGRFEPIPGNEAHSAWAGAGLIPGRVATEGARR